VVSFRSRFLLLPIKKGHEIMTARIIRGFLLNLLLFNAASLAGEAAKAEMPVKKPVTYLTIENSSKEVRKSGPATFAVFFAAGDVPETFKVKDLKTQIDIKRRWPDKSLKHAVLTVLVPEMAGGQKRKIGLYAARTSPPPDPEDVRPPAPLVLPPELQNMQVKFQLTKGPVIIASLKEAIEKGSRRTWLEGDLVRERHYRIAPATLEKKIDPDLEVSFRLRYYPGAKCARVAVVVENCHWKSPGNIPYDLSISSGGKTLFKQAKVGQWTQRRNKRLKGYIGHGRGARWIKRFWLGARRLDDLHLRNNVSYLLSSGLLPRYNSGRKITEAQLARLEKSWAKSPRELLQNGWLTPYFPTTGGRGEIGSLPSWCIVYLLSQDSRAKKWVLEQADLSAGCPVHLRDEKTGWVISIDDHPGYSFNNRGTKFKVKLRDTANTPWVLPSASHYRVDTAHQGSFAYVPYLISGDFFYLEEMQFWANHNMVAMNYSYRRKALCLLPYANQIRGVAWGLRNLVHVAALSPDSGPGRKYFENKLANNLAHFNEFLAGKLKRKPTPIGTYTIGATQAYTRGWDPKIRFRYFSMPGWQHNFLTWSLAHAAEQGYAAAVPMRNYLMKWTVGLASSPKEIPTVASSAYYLFIGRKQDAKFCQTWKEIADLTWKRPDDVPQGKAPDPASPWKGDYACIARAVLIEAARAKQPGAEKALQHALESFKGRIGIHWDFQQPVASKDSAQ
jgi:hypothetical protein